MEVRDILISAHQQDLDEYRGIADAKVQSLSEELAASVAKVSELKATNYDLLMSVPKDEIPDEPEVNTSDTEPEIDDLFGE